MLLFQEEANSHHAGASVSPLQILGAPSSFAEEESRRRLFWAIYLLDRFSASATGWKCVHFALLFLLDRACD